MQVCFVLLDTGMQINLCGVNLAIKFNETSFIQCLVFNSYYCLNIEHDLMKICDMILILAKMNL